MDTYEIIEDGNNAPKSFTDAQKGYGELLDELYIVERGDAALQVTIQLRT